VIEEYARRQTAMLLRWLAAAFDRAAREGDSQSIHEVRVAMRRLSRCLRVFAPCYPDGSAKKIRHRLSALMEAAGAVRDCDIAIDLMEQAGLSRRAAAVARLQAERQRAAHDLLQAVRRWKNRDSLRTWQRRLEL
jgi:CHAD domain-containing protein